MGGRYLSRECRGGLRCRVRDWRARLALYAMEGVFPGEHAAAAIFARNSASTVSDSPAIFFCCNPLTSASENTLGFFTFMAEFTIFSCSSFAMKSFEGSSTSLDPNGLNILFSAEDKAPGVLVTSTPNDLTGESESRYFGFPTEAGKDSSVLFGDLELLALTVVLIGGLRLGVHALFDDSLSGVGIVVVRPPPVPKGLKYRQPN